MEFELHVVQKHDENDGKDRHNAANDPLGHQRSIGRFQVFVFPSLAQLPRNSGKEHCQYSREHDQNRYHDKKVLHEITSFFDFRNLDSKSVHRLSGEVSFFVRTIVRLTEKSGCPTLELK